MWILFRRNMTNGDVICLATIRCSAGIWLRVDHWSRRRLRSNQAARARSAGETEASTKYCATCSGQRLLGGRAASVASTGQDEPPRTRQAIQRRCQNDTGLAGCWWNVRFTAAGTKTGRHLHFGLQWDAMSLSMWTSQLSSGP